MNIKNKGKQVTSHSTDINTFESENNVTGKSVGLFEMPKPSKNDYEENKKPMIDKVETFLSDRYQFRYNTLSNDLEYLDIRAKKATPKTLSDGEIEVTAKPDVWKVLKDRKIERELLKAGFVGINRVLEVVLTSDFVPEFNPITAYFNGLKGKYSPTDGDFIESFANFVDAEDQVWFNYQFKKMLVRTVACALGKIPFNKHCFTLVGKQNDGKSTFLRFLMPPALLEYYKENPSMEDKDGRLALAQNFIINFDELQSLTKKDINCIKSYITTDYVKDRLPYGRKQQSFKRVANFVASTNIGAFLNDVTGNVRWLIFNINGINHNKGGEKGYNKNVDIDKVWSQALYLLDNGFDFEISKEDIAKSEENNKDFQFNTPEFNLINQYYEQGTKDDIFVTPTQIEEQLNALTNRNVKINHYNIGRALMQLNFVPISHRKAGSLFPQRGYFVKQKFEIDALKIA
jgi:hypothetical protein